jgi:hypothetical protein
MAVFKFLSTLIGSLIAWHFLWSLVVAIIFCNVYDHRIFDMTKIPNVGREWESFTSSFFSHKMKSAISENKPSVMFIGSSVTFGYSWQEDVIYTKILSNQLPGWRVSNLSIIGVGMRAITDFATCAIGPANRPAVLFVEIPLVNSTASISADGSHAPRQCLNYSNGVPGYWTNVLTRPYGSAWIPILWDGHAYKKTEADFKISPLPTDYFLSEEKFSKVENKYLTELRRFLTSVSLMGEKVFVYISPILTSEIKKSGGDRAAVEYQILLTNKVCLEYKNVTCLDVSIFSDRSDLFYNLTHLNQRGHRALAEWFKPHIVSQGSSDVSQRPLSNTY